LEGDLRRQADERHRHHAQRCLVVLADDEQVAPALAAEGGGDGIANGNGVTQPGEHATRGPHPRPLSCEEGGAGEQVLERAVLFHFGRGVALEDNLRAGRAVIPLLRQCRHLRQVAIPFVIRQPGHLEAGSLRLDQAAGGVVDGLAGSGEQAGGGVVVGRG
jgi:hypothetical protein